MTNEEILKKAIDKAVSNGYTDWGIPVGFAIYSVIFSHSFAKAFWGEQKHTLEGSYEDTNCTICKEYYIKTSFCWQYHLQQMVLKETPLQYLEQFLGKDENEEESL